MSPIVQECEHGLSKPWCPHCKTPDAITLAKWRHPSNMVSSDSTTFINFSASGFTPDLVFTMFPEGPHDAC